MKKTGYKSHITETAGTLRARIACRQEALKVAQPDSWIWWHMNRTIAELERQVAQMEGGRCDISIQIALNILTRERDEARAERDEARVEVERLRAELFIQQGCCDGASVVEGHIAREREEHQAEVERLRNGLHHISLASQNSMSSKQECGRIARETLEGAP